MQTVVLVLYCTTALVLVQRPIAEPEHVRRRFLMPDLPSTVSVAGCPVNVSERLKNTLGYPRKCDVVKAHNCHLRALRYLRCSLARDVANTLAFSIVSSRIDYCNALLYGAADTMLGWIE